MMLDENLPDFQCGRFKCVFALDRMGRVIESQLQKWEVSAFHRELSESGATLLSLVPTQLFGAISTQAHHLLRYVIIGGGRLEIGLAKSGGIGLASVGELWPHRKCGPLKVATAGEIGSEQLWPLDHVEVKIHPNSPVELKEACKCTWPTWHSKSGSFLGRLYFDDLGKGEIRRRSSGDGLGFFVIKDRGELRPMANFSFLSRQWFCKNRWRVGVLRLEGHFESCDLNYFLNWMELWTR